MMSDTPGRIFVHSEFSSDRQLFALGSIAGGAIVVFSDFSKHNSLALKVAVRAMRFLLSVPVVIASFVKRAAKFLVLFCLVVSVNCYGYFPAEPCTSPSGSKTSQIRNDAIAGPGVKKFNDNVHFFFFALFTGFFLGIAYYTRKTK